MIDPISIGLAFTAAQTAVSHIKKAIALGKDIHGIAGEFSKFFQSADDVHIASTRAKIANVGKSNAQLGALAMQSAIHSNALREAERDLKKMLYWELGKPQIWDDMIKERTRLIKARIAEERAIDVARLKHKEQTAKQAMRALVGVGISAVVVSVIMGGISVYGSINEQRLYQEKVAAGKYSNFLKARADQQRQTEEALAAIK